MWVQILGMRRGGIIAPGSPFLIAPAPEPANNHTRPCSPPNCGIFPEQVAHPITGTCDRHPVVVGQMHGGGFDARPVLHRRLNLRRKFTPMPLAARATCFQHLMLGDFMTQRRNLEYLVGLDHHRFGQRTMAGIASTRRPVRLDVVRLRDPLQCVAGVPLLTSHSPLHLDSGQDAAQRGCRHCEKFTASQPSSLTTSQTRSTSSFRMSGKMGRERVSPQSRSVTGRSPGR